jgi:DNA modification methylase
MIIILLPTQPMARKQIDRPSSLIDTRVVYCGDNLDQLSKLPNACVDLIYIDPPFNSNRNYEVFWGETKEKRSFEDRHASTQAYIDFMRPRCIELARVLKPSGSFYYHCDWHASHYVKILLDQTIGEANFQNEIIWKRSDAKGDAGQGAKHLGRCHDSIFFYTGGSKNTTWNPIFKPLGEDYVERFYRYKDPDGRRWKMDNLLGPGGAAKGNARYEFLGVTRYWRHKKENMQKLYEEGRIIQTKPGNVPMYKRYLDESKGVSLSSLWDDISLIRGWSKEKIGYPTQKPVALLKRIIELSSNPNDIVLDAFCGCGTALVAAQSLGRQWIGIDQSPTACRVMAKRLRQVCVLPENEKLWQSGRGFIVRDLPWTPEQLRKMPAFEFENWAVIAVGGVPNSKHVGDMGIDGRIYPVSALPEGHKRDDQFAFMDDWYPVQVKQCDKVGRPDIDSFEAVMHREDRQKGYFVSFDYTQDAEQEIRRFKIKSGKEIIALTVRELLERTDVASPVSVSVKNLPKKTPRSVVHDSTSRKRASNNAQ